MKTEINLENKAKFFAQYWGQSIVFHRNSRPNFTSFESLIGSVEVIDGYACYLKPLSLITDEDAIHVAEILRPHSFKMHKKGWKIKRCEREIEITHRQSIYEFDIDYEGSLGVDNGGSWEYLGNAEQLHAYDYLRSKGYALPWMGLSVEEIVKAGWVKLQG